MCANAVEIRGLQKSFPQFRLGPLDLNVPTGSIYALVGPNGAGKTTTIDLIFGMGVEQAGTITVLGLDHRRDAVAMKRQVAYVSPELNFEPWGRVHNVIAFVRGFYPSWDQRHCERLLVSMRLGAGDRIAELSFGARVKLSLVLALSWRPRVLVLDEPTVGLDAVARRDLFTELLSMVQDEDRTVLISSHSLTDLERFADYVGILKNGRLLFEGAMADVLARFRVVDLLVSDVLERFEQPGVFVQSRDGRRCRALLDLGLAPLEKLRAQGTAVVGEAPVSLEDLFVMLQRA